MESLGQTDGQMTELDDNEAQKQMLQDRYRGMYYTGLETWNKWRMERWLKRCTEVKMEGEVMGDQEHDGRIT